MRRKIWRQRPVLNLPQIVVLGLVIVSLVIVVDLRRREQAGQAVGAGEAVLQGEIDLESTRQVELQATRAYVQSDAYVADYARNEAGYLLPGESAIVPLPVEQPPTPPPPPPPTPDPAQYAQPWQAWWQLLTDAPPPQRER